MIFLVRVASRAKSTFNDIFVNDTFAFITRLIKSVTTVRADSNLITVSVDSINSVVFVYIAAAFFAKIIVIAAALTNTSVITILINGIVHFFSEIILIAAITKFVEIFQAVLTNIIIVINSDHIVYWIVFVAMRTASVILQTAFTNINFVAIMIMNKPSLITAVVAAFTSLPSTARVTVKPFVNFFSARDTETISADGKGLIIVRVIRTDANFGIKVLIVPVSITAKAFTGS